jgi:diguanylate cyclase (GGDEF)-like protein
MELLLWRWSTAVQCTSAVMIAVFFVVLERSVRRAELRVWVGAWMANVVALLIPIAFWYLRPDQEPALGAMRGGYFLSKTAFLVLLVIGARGFTGGGLSVRPGRALWAGLIAYSIVAALVLRGFNQAGALQSGATAVLMAAGVVIVLRTRAEGCGWLVCGFVIRFVLAVVETAAYFTRVFPSRWTRSEAVTIFLSSTSSLDTAAEWVIALGCLLLFYGTIQRELTRLNGELVDSQAVLRDLVDIDPLTGLPNRRSLRTVLRQAAGTGATIVFFDLDDFKGINDSYGHQAGDDCLRRFAAALRESFGPEDHLARYGGDEFLAVTRAEEPQAMIERVREILRAQRGGPAIRVAAGVAPMPPNSNPEDALHAADAAMYAAKRSRLERH